MSEFKSRMYYDFIKNKCVVHEKYLSKWKNIAKEKLDSNKIVDKAYFEFDFIFPTKLTNEDLNLNPQEIDSIFEDIKNDLAMLGCKNIVYFAK